MLSARHMINKEIVKMITPQVIETLSSMYFLLSFLKLIMVCFGLKYVGCSVGDTDLNALFHKYISTLVINNTFTQLFLVNFMLKP